MWGNNKHIHIHIHNEQPETLRLLQEILAEVKKGGTVSELEKQMDSWLVRLDQNFKTLEQVSDQVK